MLAQALNGEILELDLNSVGESHLWMLAERIFGDRAWEVESAADLRSYLAEWIQRGFLEQDLSKLSGPQLRTLAANFTGQHYERGIPEEDLRKRLGEVRAEIEAADKGRPKYLSRADYALAVGRASERLGCPILAGGVTWHYNDRPMYLRDEWLFRNCAMWFDRTWKSGKPYAKMHPVPFSEYVPFKDSWPQLHRLLRSFVPEVMSQLEPGDEPVRFELARPDGRWQIVAPICFEATFARVCRKLVRSGPKDKLIMVNLSNNGWFVWQSRDGVNHESTEHAQDLAMSVFRTIENRVPVVRAVNTGKSASITSNGVIVAILADHRGRTLISGLLILDGARKNGNEYLPEHGPKVLVDGRVSVYSLVGDVFAILVTLAASGLTAYVVLDRLRKSKGAK